MQTEETRKSVGWQPSVCAGVLEHLEFCPTFYISVFKMGESLVGVSLSSAEPCHAVVPLLG